MPLAKTKLICLALALCFVVWAFVFLMSSSKKKDALDLTPGDFSGKVTSLADGSDDATDIAVDQEPIRSKEPSLEPIIVDGTSTEVKVLFTAAFENRWVEMSLRRPGAAKVEHTVEMESIVALGDKVLPNLLANLKNENNKFRLIVIEMLSMLNAPEAVPDLIDCLKLNDDVEDNLVAATLAKITKHPEGSRFLRRWFDATVRQEAVAAYRQWAIEKRIGF